jgi:hypothetical protein
MAELKTKPDQTTVAAFLATVDPTRRPDCDTLIEIMRAATGAEPRMWGASIVGFGTCHYKYASGREGDWFLTGFSPRKANMSVYVTCSFDSFQEFGDLMDRLGKYKTGKGCLYFKRFSDLDRPAFEQLIRSSVEKTRANWS